MVQQEKPNLLKRIDADELDLFEIFLPSGHDLATRVKDAIDHRSEPLDPTTEIIEIFPNNPPKKTIHIAVKLPDDAVKSDVRHIYQHPLLQAIQPDSVTRDLKELYRLAWKSSNRKSLFRPESANNGGFQYESIIATQGFAELYMADRILITPEYKAALSDAKRWFSGGTVLPTPPSVAGNNDDVEMRPAEEKASEEEVAWPATNRISDRSFFIVLGTPGIGKSLFLYYVLVERLLAGLPTCFQTSPGFYTFWCEEGVFRIPLDDRFRRQVVMAIPDDAWFLVDSNEMYPTPHGMLKDVKACVVQAASPRDNHIRWTDKAHTHHVHWYIKPSPLKESLLMKRLNCPETTDDQWEDFFEKYGPSTRLLVLHAKTPDRFQSQLWDKIRKVTLPMLRALLFATPAVDVKEVQLSPWICGIHPGSSRDESYCTFHTPTIMAMVKKVYQDQWMEEVAYAYGSLFKNNPFTRVPAGHMLEDRVHDVLMKGGCWEMSSLTGRSGPKNNIYQIPPTASTAWLVISSAGVRIDKTRPVQSTGALELHWFRNIESESKLGYYRPRSMIQRTLDAYIVDPNDKSVFMIQTTLAKRHDAKPGGSKDLRDKYKGYTFHYIVVGEQEIEIPMPKAIDMMWESRWCIHADEKMLFP
ncbi:hypothetical protein K435DRAFT_742812 [Dendrothele bispora CBS 962.96]|uniref:Uncharacterized protein n=1 Tax=Dendrothele bispora (strain CBS 962.96) TaxID=1314807 RepID=A0A4S8MV84_DENBC|nr:hypothetical protein K435DRAFT_742812 [Dendrothele bispora CBS 962.96]